MKFEIKKPFTSLNPAYRKTSLKREQIELFKDNLNNLFNDCDNAEKKNESEEHFKNIVSEFLKDTYFKGNHFVNTEKRKDLVIHNDKTSTSNVGVIIEVKRPSNKGEMVSFDKPNAKALHELLHYYLQERYIKDNKEIKHLIVTNIYEWYVFDGKEFERFFFDNPKLKKSYKDWNDGLFGLNKTDWFYQEIAKPFIEKELTQLTCTYFNLNEVKRLVTKTDKTDDKRLIDLYKILSSEHLLKKAFANDSNSLNKDFYNELLHIIGLFETKDGGKKVIERKEPKERDEGSLLENAINIIQSRAKLTSLKVGDEQIKTEDDYFSYALELCITWLNRILFLKLLEGQLIKYHKGDKSYSFLNINRIKDFDELNELFFEVLAEPADTRTKSVTEKFGGLPYLNSSLFEPTLLEQELFYIATLKDRLEIPIFNHTVLKEANGKRITGNKNTLQYLFEFLDAYDFASDSTAEIQEQNKTIINASVLGLIFEKINGYKDGSFFTPSFVTMFMCRETIRKAVLTKFNEQYNWKCKDFTDLYNQIDKISIKEANETINTLKVCDPAVGSGHFLVSALNEIISIKNDLGILCDKEFKRLRGYEITLENDELIVIHEENIFEYNFKDKESHRVQEALFLEKQTIIENSLFGVDINPKSAMICRLRLWIELLKNMYYKDSKFTELETLPNIDINIKAGNSLVYRFDFTDSYSKLPASTQQKLKLATQKYKDQVIIYKSTHDKATKKQAERNIAELKETFSQIANPTDKDYKKLKAAEAKLGEMPMLFSKEEQDAWKKKTEQLAEEVKELKAKYDLKLKTLYGKGFEWRFEFPEVLDEDGNFIGFDVIIGNPPYFSLSKDPNNSYYAGQYETFNTAGDIYCLFYELGVKIIAPNRYLSFITSNKWMRATYGQQLRHYFNIHTQPFYLFDFSWYQVFENANVDTNILSLSKQSEEWNMVGAVAGKDFKIENLANYSNENCIPLKFSGNDYWSVKSETSNTLKTKLETLGKKLELWDLKVNYGIKSGFNDAYQIDEKTKDELIAKDAKNAEIIMPLLRGRDVERYGYNFANLYLINVYNGYTDNIKDFDKHIEKLGENQYRYKSDHTKEWHLAKRIEFGKGHQVRVNRVILEDDYPTLFEYLKQYETGLKKREDQGTHWTNLRNCAYDSEFKKEKLVWAETMRVHKSDNQNFPRFGYDNKGTYTDKTVFIGIGEHLKYLLGFLNSSVGRWLIQEYVTKLDTGGYMMQKVFLDKVPIFEPTEEQENEIVILVDKILTNKGTITDTKELEKELDELIFKLYDLTEDERNQIEGNE